MSDPSGVAAPASWERHLSQPVRGRKVIVAFELLASMTRVVEQLRDWGAEPPLLLPEGRGTGALPDDGEHTVHELPDPRYATMTEQVRSRLDPLRLLTREARAAVQRYDPHGAAVWWVSPVLPNTTLLGRPVLGGRPPEQIRLEDKALVETVLAAVGAPRSPALLSPATYDELMDATEKVLERSGGDEVVWAGDAAQGINGGGDFVRWVRSTDQAREFAEWFGQECDHVRVSAFLEGVPCSIHGIVLPDGVVVLRPMELVSLRHPETGRFVYGGMGTTWDPPDDDTGQMRALAREVGEHLRGAYGYRGAFGIDGVLTADGFRVTELNSRLSGGLTRLGRAAADAHLELVQMNAVLGRDVGVTAAAYESRVLSLVEETRFIDAMGISSSVVTMETTEVPVTAGETVLEIAGPEDEVVGIVHRGPSPMGTFVRLTAAPGVIGLGDRAAPLGVLLLEFADRHWGTGFGRLLMPTHVRSAGPPG